MPKRPAQPIVASANDILENMKKNDQFIGDILAPFEQSLGLKFNKFDKPVDPKYEDPKKKGSLKSKLRQAEKKQKQLAKMAPDEAKKVHWKSALDKAQGIKNKDDPKLLKKTIKRKESEKKRHQKKWAERTRVQKNRKEKKARGKK